jgi:hypothetical protein
MIDFGTHPGLPWPQFEQLLALATRNAAELDNHTAAARAIERHRPVPDHGRFSDEGCLNPLDHADSHVGEPPRAPVCKTCRDSVGEPVESPCDDLVDWGTFYGIDFTAP